MHIAPILACPWTLPLKHNFGTKLVQTHSPGLGCTDFHIALGILNFYLQKESKTWRLFALRISMFYLHHIAFVCISTAFQLSISFCSAGTMGWWLMVTYQNLDLRNVIVHGNSSEQDLVQTHCLGRRLTLKVQSLQTSRQSKSGDVANCCKLLQTVANCCKLQVKTITKPTMSVLVAMCINASTPTFFSVASTMMKLCKVFYSDSIPNFATQLWLMLALTLFKATALAWAAATSTLPGVFL